MQKIEGRKFAFFDANLKKVDFWGSELRINGDTQNTPFL